jgi:hypothetical protein
VDVAKLAGLHHRRRGWAWVAVGSAIGLVVYVGIDVNLFKNLIGSAIPADVRASRATGPLWQAERRAYHAFGADTGR